MSHIYLIPTNKKIAVVYNFNNPDTQQVYQLCLGIWDAPITIHMQYIYKLYVHKVCAYSLKDESPEMFLCNISRHTHMQQVETMTR